MGKTIKDRLFGFTLAEVLITLGIIGVVAAMTLPVLIQNYRKTVIVNSLKKNYSLINTASQKSRQAHGDIPSWEGFVNPSWWPPLLLCENNKCDKFMKNFLSDVKTIKVFAARSNDNKKLQFCGSSNLYQSFHKIGTLGLPTGDGRINYSSALLPDGSCWLFLFTGTTDCNIGTNKFMNIYIDVNGPNKKPNRLGIDTFMFDLLINGSIIPHEANDCDANSNNDTGRGTGCAAKIMKDGWQIKSDYTWNW